MVKRVLILIFLIGTAILAEDKIILKDDSNSSTMVQKKIVGCQEIPIIKEQTKDIQEIKLQLNNILKKLSKIEQKSHSATKSRDIANLKRDIKRVNRRVNKKKRKTYIVVRVKRGDRLSDYAKKYYGDRRKYYKIYRANQDKIGSDLQLHVGDRIIIPISKYYKYKKFKKRKTRRVIKKHHHKKTKKAVIETPKSIMLPVVDNSSNMATYIDNSKINPVDMLDEEIYIDDTKSKNPIDISDFIPLDDN